LTSYPTSPNSTGYDFVNGEIYGAGAAGAPVGATLSAGDIMGISVDVDAGEAKFYKNGVLQTTLTHGITGTLFPLVSSYDGVGCVNFGQRPFAYTAPSGFKALCTTNLPTPTIADGSKAMDVALYTGNGSTQTISGLNFSPDLVWIKSRSNSGSHAWFDIIRGTNMLASDFTGAESYFGSPPVGGYINTFNSDGFTFANGSVNNTYVNESGYTYVAWTWDAGSSNTTIAVGGLNSSAYDQSATWSSSSGINSAASSFDGSLSTGGIVASSGSAITITTSSFTASSISFYKNGNNDSNLTTITVNGTAYTFPLQATETGWVTVNLGSEITVTSLTSTWYGGYTVYAVKADNKILVDSGVTPPSVPSIESTVRANPSAGFSVVTFTSPTGTGNFSAGHGLGVTPEFVIVKSRDATGVWYVYHKSLATDHYLRLNGTDASATDGVQWGAGMTSSVLGLRASYSTVSGATTVAYAFAPVAGYSSFGSYTGNGSADGPFVYTGFRPRFLLVRSTSSSRQWGMFDTARFNFNGPNMPTLYANIGDAETTTVENYGDFLSNGFKTRYSNGNWNGSGETYIYAAFAEHPFATARAR
jgi:hypothetical protein